MINPARLRWSCRRGMLELDLLLLPFLEKVWPKLPEKEQQLFEQLLTCSDQDLYSWLIKYQLPADQTFLPLIERIRQTDAT